MAKASTISKRRPLRSRKPASPVIRTFRDALSYLDTLVNFERESRYSYSESNFSLARFGRLLSSLGNPQRRVRTVHIAGTKGKGSTCAMLGAMLSNCGMRVGVYSSPHLLSICERIHIDSEMIGETDFAACVARVAAAAARPRVGAPTYFEALTAAAFLYFAESEVALAVIETGMGGRLDATNVVSPEVVGLTSISLDHQAQLGRSLKEIAREKAGIIKPGIPAFSVPQHEEAEKALRAAAAEVGAPLSFTGTDVEFSYRFEATRGVGRHTRLSLTTPSSRFEHLHVPLLGEHQAINCGLALAIVDALKGRGFAIDDQRASDGLAKVRIAGRMEIINDHPKILVDVAHNAASIDALMRAIGQNVIADSLVVIFGCQKHKDVRGMIRGIQLGADKIIFTRTRSPRTADPHELAAEYLEQCGRVAQAVESLDDAMAIATRAVSREDLICITGSFYLIAEAKQKYSKALATV